jgi:hypothetical protein
MPSDNTPPVHYTAVIIIVKTTEAHEKKNDRGYADGRVDRSSAELAKIEVRDSKLDKLIEKANAHLELVTEN